MDYRHLIMTAEKLRGKDLRKNNQRSLWKFL
jgi:hypothetical protein